MTMTHYIGHRFWVGETHFSWVFMCSNLSASSAARIMSKVKAFLASFVNGQFAWTIYFNDSVLNRCMVGIKAPAADSILIDPLKYGTPRKVVILSDQEYGKLR